MNKEVEAEYKLKNGTILRITRTENPNTPTEDNEDSAIFVVYDHRNCTITKKGFEPRDIYESLNGDHDTKVLNDYSNYYIFPVYVHIHISSKYGI